MTEIGPQRTDDRRGWLVFESLPNDLQRAEDATQAADFQRLTSRLTRWQHKYDPTRRHTISFFVRDATDAERTLLAHLGHTVPAVLLTRVEFLTRTMRQRRWPALEQENPA